MTRLLSKSLLSLLLVAACGILADTKANAQAPVAGMAYQVPAGYESYPAGTLITYGGYSYVAQGSGTMLLAASQAPAPPPVASFAPGVTYTNPAYVPYANYYGPVRPGWRPSPVRPWGGYGPMTRWDGWGPGPRPGWGPRPGYGMFIGPR